MAIQKILLDLDDVLGDCTWAIMRHFGLNDWVREDHTIPERDIIEMYRIKTGIQYGPNFWDHLKREFWATIPKTPWCDELIDLCLEYVPKDQIAICTATTKCGDCLAGKLDWIDAYMPDWLHRQYVMTPRKSFCASTDVVLIDDAEENTMPFGRAGGWGITLPQPWNFNRDILGQELQYVRNQLHDLSRCV